MAADDDLHEKAIDAAGRALNVLAGRILAEAVDDAPLEDSDLRNSGHVEPEVGAQRRGNYVEVEVSFNTPYAAAQHEAEGPPSWEHAKRPLTYSEPGTGPKYLENALKRHEGEVEAVVAAAVKRAVEG